MDWLTRRDGSNKLDYRPKSCTLFPTMWLVRVYFSSISFCSSHVFIDIRKLNDLENIKVGHQIRNIWFYSFAKSRIGLYKTNHFCLDKLISIWLLVRLSYILVILYSIWCACFFTRAGRYEVDGYVYDSKEEPKILMTGKWNESMSYQPCDSEGEPFSGTELKEVFFALLSKIPNYRFCTRRCLFHHKACEIIVSMC